MIQKNSLHMLSTIQNEGCDLESGEEPGNSSPASLLIKTTRRLETRVLKGTPECVQEGELD